VNEMGIESASYWAEIKKYEDMLAKDPRSYCFAPLAELYRKLGLLEDAVQVAKRGIEVHPEYVGGYMAYGRTLFEMGLKDESKAALERVVKVTPDNFLAQKLLSQIYIEQGDDVSAEKALQVLVLLNPDDVEGKLMLEALARAAEKRDEAEQKIIADEDFSFENADLYSTCHSVDECSEYSDFDEVQFDENLEELRMPSGRDPLATVTVAELYVKQGVLDRAIEVYTELLQADPDNDELKNRIFDLQRRLEVDGITPENAESVNPMVFEEMPADVEDIFSPRNGTQHISEEMTENSVVVIMEGWLENIRRGRNVH
jgi:tetratricopeptide (TPR) repeat protein